MKISTLLLILLWFCCTSNLAFSQTNLDITNDISIDVGWDFMITPNESFVNLTGVGSSAIDSSMDSYLWITPNGDIITGFSDFEIKDDIIDYNMMNSICFNFIKNDLGNAILPEKNIFW